MGGREERRQLADRLGAAPSRRGVAGAEAFDRERKNSMTIKEFADKHSACVAGRNWAVLHCATMDDVWRTAKPEWLIWIATRPGVLPERELRLFACWCARRCQPTYADQRSLAAIATAEKFARGEATEAELISARSAAWSAARSAAWASAWSAAWASARAEAWSAAESAAWAEAESAHADYVRKLSPCFD